MIDNSYEEYTGICDSCGAQTEHCETWADAQELMKDENWTTTLNEKTGEWENICPDCMKERREAAWEKRLEQIPRPKLNQNSSTEQTK